MYYPLQGIAVVGVSPRTQSASGAAMIIPPIDTLMVSNISLQASESDLRGTVSGFAGYKRSKLVNNGKSCTAWVQFEDIPCAEAAMRTLQGSSTLALDAQGLRISFSKNPMGVPGKATLPLASLSHPAAVHYDESVCFGKRSRDGSNDWFTDASKRLAAAHQFSYPVASPYGLYPATYFAGGTTDNGIMGHPYTSSMLSPQFATPYAAPWHTACYPTSNSFPAGIDAASSTSVPIDTLMIANLSLGTNEGDVQTVMYGFAGYKRSKLVNNGKSCTAWVQFEDIPCAEAAMRTLQGSSTLALDAQGLRIAFSKNPMGVTSSRASS
jgi:hypothetical protein